VHPTRVRKVKCGVIGALACALVTLPSSAAGAEPSMTITATEGKPFSAQVADFPLRRRWCAP